MKQPLHVYMLILAVLLAIATRIILVRSYAPLYGNDSPSYAELGKMIQETNFEQYDGRRTPGYPVFMLLLGNNNQLIRLFQHAFGLLSIFLVFRTLRLVMPAHYCWPPILLMALSLQFPFYESIIQTEGLSVLAVLASLYFFSAPSKNPLSRLSLVGVIASVGALIRPHLVILVPIYAVLYALHNRRSLHRILKGGVALALPFALLVGGWIGFNYYTLSQATFSTLPKGDLIAHMIHFVSDADDKYGEVKYAFVEALAVNQSQVEMADDNRAGYTAYVGQLLRRDHIKNRLELADTINAMAMDLIIKHPFAYLKEVFSAWLRFWRVHIIVYAECFPRDSILYGLALLLWMPIKCAWLVANFAFLALCPLFPVIPMSPEKRALLFNIYGIMLCASASQAFTQYYDNARFAVPFQPLVAIAVAIMAALVVENLRRPKDKTQPPPP